MFGPGQSVAEGSQFSVENLYAPVASSVVNIDITKSNFVGITPTGSFTLGPPVGNVPGSTSLAGLFLVRITQPAAGGVVVSFGSGWTVPTGMTVPTGANVITDLLVKRTIAGLLRVVDVFTSAGAIIGATMDSVVIGGTTPAAGTFSALTSTGYIDQSAVGGLTAVGTNRATALAISHALNKIATAAAGTGAVLPSIGSTVGIGGTIFIDNQGANAIQVYGSGSDTIDAVAAATGVPLTNTKRAMFFAMSSTQWISAQLGVVSA